MKTVVNEKCHACLWVLDFLVFRYSGIPPLFRYSTVIPVFHRYSGIPPLFRSVPAIPLAFHCSVFQCSVVPSFRGCSVFQCSWFDSMPHNTKEFSLFRALLVFYTMLVWELPYAILAQTMQC